MATRLVIGLSENSGTGIAASRFSLDADLAINTSRSYKCIKGSLTESLPSSFWNEDVMSIIAPGMCVDLYALNTERELAEKNGWDMMALFIDERCRVIMPWNIADDSYALTGEAPHMMDEAWGLAFRAADFMDDERFKKRLDEVLPEVNVRLKAMGRAEYDEKDVIMLQRQLRSQWQEHVIDTVPVIRDGLESDMAIVVEGEDGLEGDPAYGAWTSLIGSRSATAENALASAGIPARYCDTITGVIKAYSSTLRNMKLPTAVDAETASKISLSENEHVGWFDAVKAEASAFMNGATELVLTDLHALDGLERVKISNGYMIEGEYYSYLPEGGKLEHAKPILEDMPGWMENTSKAESFEELPGNAKAYVKRIEELVGVPVRYLASSTDEGFFIPVGKEN